MISHFVYAGNLQADIYKTAVDKPVDILNFLAPLVILTLILGSYFWSKVRSKMILEKWAFENGFRIVDSKRAFFNGGFSWLTTSRNQKVYSITVRDEKGRERSGWLRCGSYFGGIFWSDKAEVKWKEDES